MIEIKMTEHYGVFDRGKISTSDLRRLLPEKGPDELNFVLFSTSGVHGSYETIEDIEKQKGGELTFLLIRPRCCVMLYGTIDVKSNDIPHLKWIRQKSRLVMKSIGGPS